MSEIKADTRLAKVVHVADSGFAPGPVEVVINRGILEGVNPGDRFLVFGIGPHIFEPDTGEDLGKLELVRGQGEVVHVQEHLATIRTLERRRTRPAKRIIRETARPWWNNPNAPSNVIEEELSPEIEVPFESVQLGDFAKPI
nr:hypothetical protein [uncultured Rhodopila sp.]